MRKMIAAFLLTCALSVVALAGDIDTPGLVQPAPTSTSLTVDALISLASIVVR